MLQYQTAQVISCCNHASMRAIFTAMNRMQEKEGSGSEMGLLGRSVCIQRDDRQVVKGGVQNLLCQNTIINSKLPQSSPMKYVLPKVPPNAFLRVSVNQAPRKVYFKDVRMCRKLIRRPAPPIPPYHATTPPGLKLDFNTDEDNQEEDSCCISQRPQ